MNACVTLILFPFLACLSAGAQQVPMCAQTTADQSAIVDTLRSMFAAAKADDLPAFHAVTTQDFYAYDNGKRFEADELMNLIRDFHAKGYVFVWSVTDPQVHTGCNVAWVTYVNRGSIKPPQGAATETSWLESAVMAHEQSGWKVRFLHSTRVPQ